MADKRITQLDASSGLVAADLVPVVDDPAGTPVTQKATMGQVAQVVSIQEQTILSTQIFG